MPQLWVSSTTLAEASASLNIAAARPSVLPRSDCYSVPGLPQPGWGPSGDIGPRNQASGFERNLNFGCGVNSSQAEERADLRGGAALGFGPFPVLYSLRWTP